MYKCGEDKYKNIFPGYCNDTLSSNTSNAANDYKQTIHENKKWFVLWKRIIYILWSFNWILLLPKLASYSPSLFVSYGHLKESVIYLMDILSSSSYKADTKNLCYSSLGKLSLSVKRKIRPYLGDIVRLIKIGLSEIKYLITFNCALQCLSNLVCAVGSDLSSYLKPLIVQMFCGGLSTELVITSKNICDNIQILQHTIHEQLALEIWNIYYHHYQHQKRTFIRFNQ